MLQLKSELKENRTFLDTSKTLPKIWREIRKRLRKFLLFNINWLLIAVVSNTVATPNPQVSGLDSAWLWRSDNIHLNVFLLINSLWNKSKLVCKKMVYFITILKHVCNWLLINWLVFWVWKCLNDTTKHQTH